MTLNSTSNGQPSELANTTTYVVPLQQKQNQVTTGRKCTRCGKSAPEVQFYTRENTYGKRYERNICNECQSAHRKSQNIAVHKMFGPGDPTKLIRENKPPEGTPCALCGEPMYHVRGGEGVVFDHDLETNTFRGWIHFRCNTSIGGLGDTYEGLLKAVEYLKPPQ